MSTLLHEHGALAFWDFAAAAPYVRIDMGKADAVDGMDAIFLSPHKFIGGPGTPGVLVAKRSLFTNRVPDVPGGGTVAYVNSAGEHDYLAKVMLREEGGTPAIVESIRAGLVFQLKHAVGEDRIRSLEAALVSRAIKAWDACPNVEILGSHDAERLSIVSFLIRYRKEGENPQYEYLHYNFVVSLLSDLFGIQARGGCSCAGPYGHRLLNIPLDRSREFEHTICGSGFFGIKPGWVRVNLNYFLDEANLEYVIDAVRLIAAHGASLLPLYTFDPKSGLWRHRDADKFTTPMSLGDINYSGGRMAFQDRVQHAVRAEDTDFVHLREEAKRIMEDAEARPPPEVKRVPTSEDFEALRWFPYTPHCPSSLGGPKLGEVREQATD